MPLPRPARPSTLVADVRSFLAGEQRHKLLIAVLAVLMPAVIVFGFVVDGRTNIMPGEQIVYVHDWPADRSDAEIVALQKIDQVKKDKADAEKRAAYQRLADKLGIE